MQGASNIWGNHFETFVNKSIFNNSLIRFDVLHTLKSDTRSFNFLLNVYFLGQHHGLLLGFNETTEGLEFSWVLGYRIWVTSAMDMTKLNNKGATQRMPNLFQVQSKAEKAQGIPTSHPCRVMSP